MLTSSELETLDFLNGRDPCFYDSKFFKGHMVPAQEAAYRSHKSAADTAGNAAMAALLAEIDDMSATTETTVVDAPIELITTADPTPALPLAITSVPVRAPMAPPARVGSDYEFPIAPRASSAFIGTTEFREALQNLTAEFKASKSYGGIREQFCAVSIALNEQRLWAPRFRPQPKINPVTMLAPISKALHRDHLVIDAHWLWANKHRAAFSSKYERLLDSTQPFDFALATQYAQKKWTSDYRAEHLGLASQVQWQLFTTKSNCHADSHRLLVDGDRPGKTRTPASISRIKKAIATWAYSSHPIRGQEQAYADLWLAREMLGAKGTLKDIAILAGLMGGHAPLDASTARHKLKGLDRRLGLA